MQNGSNTILIRTANFNYSLTGRYFVKYGQNAIFLIGILLSIFYTKYYKEYNNYDRLFVSRIKTSHPA